MSPSGNYSSSADVIAGAAVHLHLRGWESGNCSSIVWVAKQDDYQLLAVKKRPSANAENVLPDEVLVIVALESCGVALCTSCAP